MENSMEVPQKAKNRTTIRPSNPLLGIYPEKTIIQKESCTAMFIAALFTIARTWKQPKRPSTDEWIKKMWHIHTMEHYSDIKKKRNWVICSEVDGPRVCHTEWSQSKREKQILFANIYIWNLKKKTKKPAFDMLSSLSLIISSFRFKVRDVWLFLSLEHLEAIVGL